MKSKAYWENRAGERMVRYMDDAEETAREIGSAYLGASKYIEKEAKDIFKGFQAAFKLSESEARSILSTKYSDTALNELKKAIANMSDNEERQKAIAAISSPAYQYRINRLNALSGNISATCNEMYKTELKATTNLLTKEVQNAYLNSVYDIQKGYNVGGAFDIIPQSRIDQILKTPWSGAHYSDRIWNNTQHTADELKRELLTGMLTGKSEQEMSRVISSRFKVSANQARCLVRTEANYVTNQAEKESLLACGCEKYEFTAVLDDKTSDMCNEHDGKQFKISEAVAGVDLPPLHPWCRSTIVGVFPTDEEMRAIFEKGAKEFGLDEPFDEWEKHLEQTGDGKWVYNPSKTPDFETKSEKFEDNSSKTIDFIKSNVPETLDNTAGGGIIKMNQPPISNELEEVKDFEQLENYLQNKWGVTMDSTVKQLDFQSVKEGVQGIEWAMNEFPQARGYWKRLDTTNKKCLMSSDYTGKINFYSEYYRDRITALVENAKWGNGSNIMSTGAHEAGHILEKALIRKEVNESYGIVHWSKNIYAKKVVSEAWKNAKKSPKCKGKNLSRLKNEISSYAKSDDSECLAEAVWDYSLHGDNSALLSKEIWKILKRELG